MSETYRYENGSGVTGLIEIPEEELKLYADLRGVVRERIKTKVNMMPGKSPVTDIAEIVLIPIQVEYYISIEKSYKTDKDGVNYKYIKVSIHVGSKPNGVLLPDTHFSEIVAMSQYIFDLYGGYDTMYVNGTKRLIVFESGEF